jgi:hypothetical protein
MIVYQLTEAGSVPLRVRYVDSENALGETALVLQMERPPSLEQGGLPSK